MFNYCGYYRYYNICDKSVVIPIAYSMIFIDYSAYPTDDNYLQENDAADLLYLIGPAMRNILKSDDTATWIQQLCSTI